MSCFHIILHVSVFNLQSLKKSWSVLNYTKKPDRKKEQNGNKIRKNPQLIDFEDFLLKKLQ